MLLGGKVFYDCRGSTNVCGVWGMGGIGNGSKNVNSNFVKMS
jgi:hypothetical protein